jgi:hypothetical protein
MERDCGNCGRHGEDYMEIGHRQQLGLAVGQPLSACQSLALRAVPVTAGVVGDADQAAIAAGFRVAAERRRPARSDGAHDSDLSAAEMPGMDLAIDITVAAEHLRHFQDWRHDGSGRRLILQPQPVERALRIADRGVGDLRIA